MMNAILEELKYIKKEDVFSTIINLYNQKKSYEKFHRDIDWIELMNIFNKFCEQRNIDTMYMSKKKFSNLEKYGFDIDFEDAYGRTLLFYLIHNSKDIKIQFKVLDVLNKTKKLDKIDNYNQNILFYLMSNRHILEWEKIDDFLNGKNLIDFMEKHKELDITIVSQNGNNLINQLFLGSGEYFNIYQYLKEHGASINHETKRKETLLHHLLLTRCNKDTKSIFWDLIPFNDIEKQNQENETIIDRALNFLNKEEDIKNQSSKKWLDFIFQNIIDQKIHIKNDLELKQSCLNHKKWNLYSRNTQIAQKLLVFLEYNNLNKKIAPSSNIHQKIIKV
jgi:hypothetical protein